ncbi:MAG TPA: hypothetical protein PK079_13050 [Leptospiraceae bacterium]|nr:hypothetical protein [Leptospiraceae bacterium]HMW07645.1 hypothetical protein [Leptospiraceae bacterium]HMX33995.1 hypothetical protein [Leptospiraceae bacterium]HMY33236.1 hypothetical protein [Leptospiraceae bacterium]HMZ65742.1 hypothetical protein [Leptospiraceae bacterium]
MSKTNLKVKKNKKKLKSTWFELISNKEEFKNIVNILNRYYNLNPTKNHPSPAHLFREEVVQTDEGNLRIFLKKFGEFEFLIVVEISSASGKKMDSWIHIDGIAQERLALSSQGISNHPVFQIISMDDLFQKNCQEVERGFRPKAEEAIA